jgi:presenilin-like A22 family membrane protease
MFLFMDLGGAVLAIIGLVGLLTKYREWISISLIGIGVAIGLAGKLLTLL